MKTKFEWERANEIASNMVLDLQPACERVEIAGSLRRHKPQVGDIEIVIIPKISKGINMFGNVIELGTIELDAVIKRWNKPLIKNGAGMKQVDFGDIYLDLFIVNPAKWGVVFTIRTGCADFSHWLVTKRSLGGGMPSNMRTVDGILYNGNDAIPTPEEADFFKAINVKCIDPIERTDAFWGSKLLFV